MDCEKWRKEINLDEVIPTWDFKERQKMFQYYPQYYHKTDKVKRAMHPFVARPFCKAIF